MNEIMAARDYMRQAVEVLETKQMKEWPMLADLAAYLVDNK